MINLNREQLYAWVWSSPVTKVASELGISGSALAKKCRLNDIPTPGRGYWRRREQGKEVVRVPLPYQKEEARSFLGEVDEGRAEMLNAEIAAMVGPNAESDGPKNLNTAPAFTNAFNGKSDSTEEVVATESAEVKAVGKLTKSQSRRMVTPFSSFVDPSDVLDLATQVDRVEAARRFIRVLISAVKASDASTQAVLALWAKSAVAIVQQANPIDQVIQECHQVAAGKASPAWFISALSKSDAS